MLKFNRKIFWLILFICIGLTCSLILSLFRKEKYIHIDSLKFYNSSVNYISPTPILPTSLSMPTVKDAQIRLAVALSLSKQTPHIAEFHLLYDSWRFIQNFSPLSKQVLIDLIVFCENPSYYQLPSSCVSLSHYKNLDFINKCLYHKLDDNIVQEWQDYLYMTSIAFMLTEEYRKIIFNYQWVLRVDQDALLSPALLIGLLEKHRIKLHNMQFGGVGHGIDFTHSRLEVIAKKLGYKHLGIHNLCSTWLVHPQDSIDIANLTTKIGRHFLKNEFGSRVPGKQLMDCCVFCIIFYFQ